ncbi:MAG: stage V sporulation protein AA [Eubacteriales bacterium]|nr:stage V sporulation protein AA [Eubacteriales bacterium]
MERPIIYIQPEQSAYLNHTKITVKDVGSVFCEDKKVERNVGQIEIYRFREKKEGKISLSVLYLIEKILERYPGGEVRNVGEKDCVLYYKNPSEEDSMPAQKGKILFVAITCFFGMGISIMGYNNDVDMGKVLSQLYEVFLGTRPTGPTFVELFYSIGLTVGIFVFFKHMPGKKVTGGPTPIQVQMRLYEQDVNQTIVLDDSRKGEELDVGNHR